MNLVKEHKGVKIFVSTLGEFYCDVNKNSNDYKVKTFSSKLQNLSNQKYMNEINKMIGKDYSNYTWNELMEAIDFIESLDLKENYYQWVGDGETEYNFQSFEVDIDCNKCYIWLHLQLDPSPRITYSNLSTKFDSTLDTVNQFAIMFNKGEL